MSTSRGTSRTGRRMRTGSTRAPKTALLVAQKIVAEIADNDLGPGAPLPSEKHMLEQYGVARGTLREAMRFLEMQDVVTMKIGPGGGPLVSDRSTRAVASTVALMSHLARTPFRDVLEARLVLEPALAIRAAERATDEQLEEIERSVRLMQDSVGDTDVFLNENATFHGLIADAAGNEVLGGFLGSLHWIIDARPLGADYTLPERKTVAKAHVRIAAALRTRDGSAAAAAMLKHVEDFATYLERRHPEILDEPLRWDQLQW